MLMCRWVPGICLVFLAACGLDRPAIRLGTFGGWPGYEPLYLARDIGYLNAAQLRLVDYNSSTPMQNDFAQGVIEAATLTLDEAVRLAARRSDFRIVLLLDESRGADAIIAQPAYSSLAMLKGRRIGLETSGVGTFLLGRALEKSGMGPGDIQTISLRFDEQERAFTQGEVEAIASFEPLKSRLTASGARVIFDSSEIPGEILDVLVVREDILLQRRKEIRDVISAWFRALAHMRKHEEQSRARVARRFGVPEKDVEAIWRGVQMGDEAMNRRAVDQHRLESSLSANAQILHNSRILEVSANPALVDLSVLQEVLAAEGAK